MVNACRLMSFDRVIKQFLGVVVDRFVTVVVKFC